MTRRRSSDDDWSWHDRLGLEADEIQPRVEVVHVRDAVFHNDAPRHRRIRDEPLGIGRAHLRDLSLLRAQVAAQLARDVEGAEADRKSTRLNSSHIPLSRMP